MHNVPYNYKDFMRIMVVSNNSNNHSCYNGNI